MAEVQGSTAVAPRDDGFPKYRLPHNRSPRAGWHPEADRETDRDIMPASLGLYLTEDRQVIVIDVFATPLSPEGFSQGEDVDAEPVGELSLSVREAAELGASLLARVPSKEDFAGEEPGGGLIGPGWGNAVPRGVASL